jgi:hypothetical protein
MHFVAPEQHLFAAAGNRKRPDHGRASSSVTGAGGRFEARIRQATRPGTLAHPLPLTSGCSNIERILK